MSLYVLDASAMVAYLTGEPGMEIVKSILEDVESTCYAHSINLCEVFYDWVRRHDHKTADQLLSDLQAAGIVEQSVMTQPFWRKVGLLKAKGRISLADCFCIALAQELGAMVLTADHHEFNAIAALGIVPIQFIR